MKSIDRPWSVICRKSVVIPVLVVAVAVLTYARISSAQVAPLQTIVPPASNAYIVMFRPGTTRADRTLSVQRAGALTRFNYTIVDAAAVLTPTSAVVEALMRDSSVVGIIPDRPVYAIRTQIDIDLLGRSGPQVVPAGVRRVGVPTNGSNGQGIGVAIVDTGLDFAHPDLAPASQSFTAFGASCQDDNGHGTHVTGIAAALNNSIDVVGVAPNARPYCVKVLDLLGTGSDATVIAGLDWIFNNHSTVTPRIRVVNMSLGRRGSLDDNPALRESVRKLYDLGIVVVVAAGNESSAETNEMVPATYPEVFAVASTTAVPGNNSCLFFAGRVEADTASYFSTDGRFDPETRIGVTISAPGEEREDIGLACFIDSVGIPSTRRGGGTTRMSGTSMASPHVAGIVARLMESGIAGPENIRSILRANADRLGTAPLDSPTSGYSFDGEREGIGKAP